MRLVEEMKAWLMNINIYGGIDFINFKLNHQIKELKMWT
jgi:hypothetical protein